MKIDGLENPLKKEIIKKINKYENINKKLSDVKEYFKKIETTDNKDKIFNQKLNKFNEIKNNSSLQIIEQKLNEDRFLIHLNEIFERAKHFQIIEQFEIGKMFIKIVKLKIEKEESKFEEIITNLNEIKIYLIKKLCFKLVKEN